MLSTYPIVVDECVLPKLESTPRPVPIAVDAFPVDLEREKEGRLVIGMPHPFPGTVTARMEISINNGISWSGLIPPFELTSPVEGGPRKASVSPFATIPAAKRQEAFVRVLIAGSGQENVNAGFVYLQTR